MSRPAGPPGAAAPLIRLQDVGVRFGRVQALHLEHLTLLWIRMVRAGGRSANIVWAALRR